MALIALVSSSFSQEIIVGEDSDGRKSIRAIRFDKPVEIDGILDESIYTTVKPIGDFIQHLPNAGEDATEKTEAWVFYDDDNIYVTAKVYESVPEEEFKVQEVADKLKLQLKKLELIRLLSEQMLKRKRLGKEIRSRGMKGNIKSIYSTEYNLSLFELLKSYSSIIMTKDFQKINIPKLPVFTTEEGIKTIKEFFGNLIDWKKLDDLIPSNFKKSSKYKRTGKAGIFAGSLELVKEGNLKIKQENLFEDIYIKETND